MLHIVFAPTTFLHLTLAMLAVWVGLQLREFAALLLVSILLAVTFEHVVSWLERHGVSRPRGIFLLLLGLVTAMFAVFLLLLPSLFSQMQAVAGKMPELRKEILGHLPNGWIARQADSMFTHPEKLMGEASAKVVAAGTVVLLAASKVLVALVFAFYFLVEGRRTFEWLVTFFRPQNQRKIREASVEVASIISAYVAGQIITSLSIAVFTAVLLSLLHVPGALPLAVIAAILDIVPVIGVTLSIFAAVLLALSVSASAALWVALAYLIYQGVENYLIAPLVYGNRMRISNLVVLLAVAMGGLLAGAIGVIIALPLAAAYPVVERIWLRKYLGDRVVKGHHKIEEEPPSTVLPRAG